MYDEAEAAYREAVRLDPGNPQYHDDLGHALFARQMYDEAEAAYREAVRLDPGNVEFVRDLAAHWKIGRSRAVQELWQGHLRRDISDAESEFGILRLEISGNWSVDAFVQLLTQVEQAYFAAAALEALAEPSSIGALSPTGPREQTAKELLDSVVAFRLGGGLQVRSLHYGSPGYVEVIGALNPLQTIKDGITENREINLKREEAELLDERERQRQSDEHEQVMEGESRQTEQMRLEHEREMIKLRIEAEKTRAQTLLSVIDRLPPEQRTHAAAELFQMLTRNTESIANDARVGEARMLETGEQEQTEPVKTAQIAEPNDQNA
jgi:tetratricopeptide (TPR) repeat protein